MCRFLLVRSTNKINPEALLNRFADMAEKSRAPDGDWQGDGWGVAWYGDRNTWDVASSLLPVWKDRQVFEVVPDTQMFVAHARSASFPQHKGVLAYNQPYINEDYAFVFNGLLRGVALPDIPGRIGAEKIWYLVKQELRNRHPQEALEVVKRLLIKNSREIVALNLGLANSKALYSLSYFTKFPEYYQLQRFRENDLEIICSQTLGNV